MQISAASSDESPARASSGPRTDPAEAAEPPKPANPRDPVLKGIDDAGLAEFLERQDGVISRAQAADVGCAPHDVRRFLRGREWVRVYPGVYVNHTGPLTWRQRAWAAVLLAWPAALDGESAMRSSDGPGRRGADDGAPIRLAVDRTRSQLKVDQNRLVVRQVADLHEKVAWNKSPPRVRIEHAVLDRAANARDEFSAIEVIADAVQSRRTSAGRIREILDARPRVARREFLAAILDDVRDGACSVLEQGYLERVERAHGLPVAQRQVGASASGPIYRDVSYTRFGQLVELDGRLFHDSAGARDRDLDRDLDAAVDRLGTVRIGWGQVFRRPCRTAERIARLLQQAGWDGTLASCPDCADGRQSGDDGNTAGGS